MFLLVKFSEFDLPKSMFKFINAEMTPKKRERSQRAILFRVIWLCMSCVLCFLMKIGNFKVKFDVCVRYNRIPAYCVPTLCVLRTVLIPPEYCVPKGGCHPQNRSGFSLLSNLVQIMRWIPSGRSDGECVIWVRICIDLKWVRSPSRRHFGRAVDRSRVNAIDLISQYKMKSAVHKNQNSKLHTFRVIAIYSFSFLNFVRRITQRYSSYWLKIS